MQSTFVAVLKQFSQHSQQTLLLHLVSLLDFPQKLPSFSLRSSCLWSFVCSYVQWYRYLRDRSDFEEVLWSQLLIRSVS